MKKMSILALLVTFILLMPITLMSDGTWWTNTITKDVMRVLPETRDFRNYFFLQSLDDSTSILIGDFSGQQEMIIQIIDQNSDNTIDAVYEYFPKSKKLRVRKDSSISQYFSSDIGKMKRDIISGSIYQNTYTYQMKSMETLSYVISADLNLYTSDRGYIAKFIDPDTKTMSMAEFYFRKENNRYDLQFKTNYYKIFRLEIHPTPPYSVYCRNSKDPIVAETVEKLLKDVAK
ncbi:MAG: hypothetical protein KA369_10645 [Spirochaetes bacterium]|nr:hypothetical protein [Spirochaetota bacterium]